MERENLSAGNISKKLIGEYVIASIIAWIMSAIISEFFTRDIDNLALKLGIQIIVSTIITLLYVWIGSKKIIKKYFIMREDIGVIIRNISIFLVIILVIGFVNNYNSYQKAMKKAARLYSISNRYDMNDVVDEAINRYKSKESYSDMYSNLKEKQEEKFKKEFSKKYGYIIFVPSIYNVGLYGVLIFLQRKWLLNVAE